MENISGNANNWVNPKGKKDSKEVVKEVKKKEPLNTEKTQGSLKNVIQEIEEMYKKNPCKELYDANVNLILALSAVEKAQ